MGVVYRATHSELGRAVALKFVSVSSSEAVARFQTEARTIAGLSHPNIVQIYEVGEHQGRPFLALELMSGGTLDDRLRQHVLSPRQSAEVVASLADRLVPGVMESIRVKFGAEHPAALLSRSVAAVRGQTLVYALPGSVRAVEEYLGEILKTLEHAVCMVHGLDTH